MLKKITQGEWEFSERTIQTVGGTYVGCASTKENAQIMACGPRLYKLLEKMAEKDQTIQAKIEEIFKTR